MGPRTKLLKVAENAGSVEDIQSFAHCGAELNILRNAYLGVRSVASGIRCWGLFCDATQRGHFPPIEDGVSAWPSFFACGRTFVIFASYLEKVCTLIGVDPQ